MAAGRRRTAQATVLFSALLCAVELLTDASALWEWIREGRWTPAAALIAAIVVAGAAQLAVISGGGGIGLSSNTIFNKNNNNNNYGIGVEFGGGGEKNWPQHRHQSAAACVRALLVVLRVSWMDEAARALLRPTYVTLHPRFLRPDVLLVDAALKALPQGILQLALSMQSNNININHDFYKSGNNNSGDISPDNEQLAAAAGMTTTTNNIIGSPSTGALSVATAALAIGHAMAVHEVGNFKQRQILAPVTSTSTTFLALLAFRACEAAMRMILLTVAVTGVCGAVVTALIVTMEVFGIIILRVTTWRSLSNAAASTKNKIAGSNAAAAKGPRRHRSSSLHWVWSVLAFVYIDHKIDRKVVISAEEGGGIRGRRGTATSAAETGVGWNQRIASLVDARLYYSIRALQCIFAGASVALLNHGLFAGLPFLHAANTTTAATTAYTTTITSTLSSIIITATNLNHYYTTTTSDAAAAATAPAPLPLAHQVAWCLLCLFMVCLFPSVYRTHWRPPTRLGRHSRQRQQRHGKNNVNSNSSNANASNRTSLTTPVASLLSATSYTSPFSQASSPFIRYLTPESLHLRQAFTGALSPSSAAKSRNVVNELLQSPRLARRRRLVAGLHSNASEATTIGGVPTAMPLPVSRNPFHQRQHKQRIQTPSYPSSHQSPSGGGINDSGSSSGGGGVVVGGDGSVEGNLDPRVTPMAMVMAPGSSKISSLLLSTGRTPRRQVQRLQTPSYLSSHQRRQSPHGVLSVSRIGTPLRRSSQLRT